MKKIILMIIAGICISTQSVYSMERIRQARTHITHGAHTVWRHRNKIGYSACLIAESYCKNRLCLEQLQAPSLLDEVKIIFQPQWFPKIVSLVLLKEYFLTDESLRNNRNIRYFEASDHFFQCVNHACHYFQTLSFAPSYSMPFIRFGTHLIGSYVLCILELIQGCARLARPL